MIYISSACVRSKTIKEAVTQLCQYGFKNIELSSGTEYYDGLENDLLEIKGVYNLNYLCHNYFPPPAEHFVLNLASLDDEIYEKSLEHLYRAISLASKLGAEKYGFHAGFLTDIQVHEIGNRLSFKRVYNRDKALERFSNAVRLLQKEAGPLKLYIENNVLSFDNKIVFKETKPFLLVDYEDYLELKRLVNFNLLLDIAHLKVSCNTLGKDLNTELDMFLKATDYIHVSDNDGLSDQNKDIPENSELTMFLSKYNLEHFAITLEVYDSLIKVLNSYNNILDLVRSKLMS